MKILDALSGRRGVSKRLIIAVCSVVYFVSYLSRKNFAVVMAAMISGDVIDKVLGGFIGMGMFVLYGVGQVVSGYLGDKIKPVWLMTAGIAMAMVTNALMPLAAEVNTVLLVPIWSVNGFAQALLWPPILKLLAENLDNETYVTANLVVTSATHIATICLYLLVPVLLPVFGWQAIFYVASAGALIAIPALIIGLHIAIPESAVLAIPRVECAEKSESEKSETPKAKPVGSFGEVFNKSGLLTIMLMIIAMGYLRDGIESWLPTLYSEVFNRDASESILVSVVVPIGSILAVVLMRAVHKTPLFANEVRSALILFASALVLCIPLCFTLGSESVALRIFSLIAVGLITALMHGCNFMLISCVPGYFAKSGRASTAGGVCNACTYVGAAASMYGIAGISEALGWVATVVSWIIIAGIGITFAILSYKKFTAFKAEVLSDEEK